MQQLRDAILVLAVSLTLLHVTASQDTSPRVYDPLKQSEFLKAKAMLRWLINNRTENNTQVFNAGFIRLAFHDCVGGCDGCINMQNPGNVGLDKYKEPLDLLYQRFGETMMSRADWYALAGYTAVEYAAALTPCNGTTCKPPMEFKWGRKTCANESRLIRNMPGPGADPRATIRSTFRMNLEEIVALMGAHTLGKNHGSGATWVTDGARFDNQYYIDLIDPVLKWRKGAIPGSSLDNTWAHGVTGNNIMLNSDFFMAFDVGTGFADCNIDPINTCRRSNTFETVVRFANDNSYWLTRFGAAFSVMLHSGNFGKLRSLQYDTFDEVYQGMEADLFPSDGDFTGILANTTIPASEDVSGNPVADNSFNVSSVSSSNQNTTGALATNVTELFEFNPTAAFVNSTAGPVVVVSSATADSVNIETSTQSTSTSVLSSTTTKPTTTTTERSIKNIAAEITNVVRSVAASESSQKTEAIQTTTILATTTKSPTTTSATTTTTESPTTTSATTTTTKSPTATSATTTTKSTTTTSTTTTPTTTTTTTESPTTTTSQLTTTTTLSPITTRSQPVTGEAIKSSTTTHATGTVTESRVGYLSNVDFSRFRRRWRKLLSQFSTI